MDSSDYRCSFCGELINGVLRPIVITFEVGPDEFHNLYCHQACLRKSLHPSMPLGGKGGGSAPA